MSRLSVPQSARELIAVTDGSGSKVGLPCGYAAILISTGESKILPIVGASTLGSSQAAEVQAVAEVVSHLVRNRLGHRSGGFRCPLITDSAYVAGAVNSLMDNPLAAVRMKSHLTLWAGVLLAAREGIRIDAFHVPRNSNPLMALADKLAGDARKTFLGKETLDISRELKSTLETCRKTFPIK